MAWRPVLVLLAAVATPAWGGAAARNPLPDDFAAAVAVAVKDARTDPDGWAARARGWRGLFVGDRVVRPGLPTLQTVEGVPAVDEAIAFLDRQPPVAGLIRSPMLDHAARDHADDQSRTGATGHQGADGSRPATRMARYARWRGVAETIAYGGDTPEAMVLQLIIDDGVPGRGHRAILFDPDYSHLGVACADHPIYRTVCVLDFGRRYDRAVSPGP